MPLEIRPTTSFQCYLAYRSMLQHFTGSAQYCPGKDKFHLLAEIINSQKVDALDYIYNSFSNFDSNTKKTYPSPKQLTSIFNIDLYKQRKSDDI
jgi:hypothetical protein